ICFIHLYLRFLLKYVILSTKLASYLLYFLFGYIFSIIFRWPPTSTLFPYTTLFRSFRGIDAHTGCEILASIGRELKIPVTTDVRSEEHTSELQSRGHLVCRLLLEKKKRHEYHTSELKSRTNLVSCLKHYKNNLGKLL